MAKMKKDEVWIFVELQGGEPADVSLELLSKGRKLAEALKGDLKGWINHSNLI